MGSELSQAKDSPLRVGDIVRHYPKPQPPCATCGAEKFPGEGLCTACTIAAVRAADLRVAESASPSTGEDSNGG